MECDKMASRRLYPLLRIYLDTNVLVSAILESDEEWLKTHPQNQKKLATIAASAELYSKWGPENLKTSVFSVAEFISKGRTEPFGRKSFEEMFEIAADKILSKCQILHVNLPFEKLPNVDKRWKKFWQLVNISGKGTAVQKGKPYATMEFSLTLSTDMQLAKSFFGGIPEGFNVRGDFPLFRDVQSSSYTAPAFEILLFSRISEIANALNIHFTDAVHVLCARGEAEFIITNDEAFAKRWKDDPELKNKAGMDVKNSVEFVEFCKKHSFL
jgi:predicted nucleic acid-binding protein